MRVIALPSGILAPDAMHALGYAGAGPVRVPWIDEDEATLAVQAARALLSPDAKVEKVEAIGPAAAAWAPVAQLALGLRGAALAILDQPPTGPLEDRTLRIVSHAPRPNTPAAPATHAHALAEMPGPGTRDLAPRRPRMVDAATVEKLARWEARAPTQVAMGAYVPLATWNADAEARYRLLASRCPHCNRGHHPPLPTCPVCGRPTTTAPLRRPGGLYTFTSIAAGGGPTEFDPVQDVEGTYAVGIVDFEGIRVAGMVADTLQEELRIGAPMEPIFRRLYAQDGAWRYGTKFRLATDR